MRYDGEENNLQRTDRENAGTWVDWLQKSMEVKSYKSVSKMLQLLMNNDTSMKKNTRNYEVIRVSE